MNDYSKPIGWWCSIFGGQRSDKRECPDCIPVYAVIPEGEREETTIDKLEIVLAIDEARGFLDHAWFCDGTVILGKFSAVCMAEQMKPASKTKPEDLAGWMRKVAP